MPIDLYTFIITILNFLFPELFKPVFSVSGAVRDEAGDALGGVGLTLTNDSTGETLNAISGEDGSYSFPSVKAGAFSLSGFKDNQDGSHYEGGISFEVLNQNVNVDLTMVKTGSL